MYVCMYVGTGAALDTDGHGVQRWSDPSQSGRETGADEGGLFGD